MESMEEDSIVEVLGTDRCKLPFWKRCPSFSGKLLGKCMLLQGECGTAGVCSGEEICDIS
jgi:hypothetical protein